MAKIGKVTRAENLRLYGDGQETAAIMAIGDHLHRCGYRYLTLSMAIDIGNNIWEYEITADEITLKQFLIRIEYNANSIMTRDLFVTAQQNNEGDGIAVAYTIIEFEYYEDDEFINEGYALDKHLGDTRQRKSLTAAWLLQILQWLTLVKVVMEIFRRRKRVVRAREIIKDFNFMAPIVVDRNTRVNVLVAYLTERQHNNLAGYAAQGAEIAANTIQQIVHAGHYEWLYRIISRNGTVIMDDRRRYLVRDAIDSIKRDNNMSERSRMRLISAVRPSMTIYRTRIRGTYIVQPKVFLSVIGILVLMAIIGVSIANYVITTRMSIHTAAMQKDMLEKLDAKINNIGSVEGNLNNTINGVNKQINDNNAYVSGIYDEVVKMNSTLANNTLIRYETLTLTQTQLVDGIPTATLLTVTNTIVQTNVVSNDVARTVPQSTLYFLVATTGLSILAMIIFIAYTCVKAYKGKRKHKASVLPTHKKDIKEHYVKEKKYKETKGKGKHKKP